MKREKSSDCPICFSLDAFGDLHKRAKLGNVHDRAFNHRAYRQIFGRFNPWIAPFLLFTVAFVGWLIGLLIGVLAQQSK